MRRLWKNGRASFVRRAVMRKIGNGKKLEKMVVDVRNAQDDFLQQPFCNDCQVVLIDHLDCMVAGQPEAAGTFIKDHRRLFVFLSRGTLPGWLMPF